MPCTTRDSGEAYARIRRLAAAADAAADAIIGANLDGAITTWNRAAEIILVNAEAERMFGYERGALLGMNVDALVPRPFAGNSP